MSITIQDVDGLLQHLDEVEISVKRLRGFLVEGYGGKDTPARSRPVELGVDISGIRWKLKGGGDAGPDEGWAWAFASSESGGPWPECEAILDAIKHSYDGVAHVGNYEVTLSRDSRFLNRRIRKAEG